MYYILLLDERMPKISLNEGFLGGCKKSGTIVKQPLHP